jgi:N utilization substance protein A
MSFGSTELVQIADAVSREKGITKASVIEAMENAIQIAARRKYGFEHDIRAIMNPKSGEVQLYKVVTVVADDAEELDEHTQMRLSDDKKKNASLEIGSEIKDILPPIDFGRIAAQSAKQVIIQKVRDAERDVQFAEFKDKIGEIASGVVKRMEYGNVIIDFGRTEAVVRREQLLPRETFRTGDRIRAYISDVRREKTGPQIFLSRVDPAFMAKLFKQEVPEIYDGLVEIKAVARDPGSRAKIAVYTTDPSVNPMLACVGVRGSRVQAVVNELQGEKVDIVEWSPDQATFVINALSSAEVSKVVIDEDSNRIEVVVPEDQLSLAIGRRGQNVRLASQLTGWRIDILTDEEESNRRAEEFNRLSLMFVDALNVEEVIAQLLVTEGFSSVEEVAFVPLEDLAEIEGFDEGVAAELQSRANDWLNQQRVDAQNKLQTMGVQDSLAEFDGLQHDVLVKLAENGVKTLDDFADLARDEFKEFVPQSNLSDEEIDALIMRAREHWFEATEGAAKKRG